MGLGEYVGAIPDALPILLDHLQRPYPSRVREGIARALATSQSKFAWEVFTRLYREESATDAKDGLAVAIAAAADDDLIEDVISLARDKTQGPSRLLLLRALERSRDATSYERFGGRTMMKRQVKKVGLDDLLAAYKDAATTTGAM